MSIKDSQPKPKVATTQQFHPNIIVIGAGISGLACASQLKSFGNVNVNVLEGRKRIGGRTYSIDMGNSMTLDLGAAWIHGIEGNPIYKEFKHLLKLVDTPSGLVCDPETGKPLDKHISRTIWHRAMVSFEIVTNWVKANPTSKASWAEILQIILTDVDLRNQLLKDLDPIGERAALALIRTVIGNYEGADSDDVAGIQEAATHQLEGREPIVQNGYRQVVHELAKHVNIALNQPVQHIEYSSKGVTVKTCSGVHHADAIVCTIPLGVLKKSSKMFSPPLPKNKITAIAKMGMGLLDKVVLCWEEKWWTQEHMDFATFIPRSKFSDEQGIYILECLDMTKNVGKPCLVFITSHTCAATLETWTDEEIEVMFLDLLSRTFTIHVPKPKSMIATRWNQDPFSLGAYSYVPVGMSSVQEIYETIEDLRAPLCDEHGVPRVYFAGEHTSKYWFSFTHGAFSSGQIAAGLLLKNVRDGKYKPHDKSMELGVYSRGQPKNISRSCFCL
jgi:monoamine oxidase